jgi:hypothetical protein
MKKRRALTQGQKRLDGWISSLNGKQSQQGLRELLLKIADGEDANKLFGLNRGRGRNEKQSRATYKKNMAVVWVASAVRELGIERSEAILKGANIFQIDEETLSRYAQNLDDVLNSDGSFNYLEMFPKN